MQNSDCVFDICVINALYQFGHEHIMGDILSSTYKYLDTHVQGCIFRLTCSYPELTEDHVLTSAYVKILRTVTRNAVNEGV